MLLSLVIATQGNFSDHWLEQLLAIQGDVQLLLVYPPGVNRRVIADRRVHSLTSPAPGDLMQSLVGLLNADGRYVMILDQETYVHPEIAALAADYFSCFPTSLALRLMPLRLGSEATDALKQPWKPLPALETLAVAHRRENPEQLILQEVPVAPLARPVNWRRLLWPWGRRESPNTHLQKFSGSLWRNDKLQQMLPDLGRAMQIGLGFAWMPRSGLDLLLGLYLQAYYYPELRLIGHSLPGPAQIRLGWPPPAAAGHRLAELLLVRRFSQYGYFWNLLLSRPG